MKRDKETGTVLTLVPAASNVDKDAAIAAALGKERRWTDEMRMASNSKTFLRMEESIRDADLMARVVQDLIVQAVDDDGVEMEEHLVWGVLHLSSPW
jgi:hypothetical protein